MKRLLAAFLCFSLVTAAYAQKTKTQMNNEVYTNLPDNTTGLITPAILRTTILDIIQSYIDLNGSTNFACAANNFLQVATLNAFTCGQSNAAGYLSYESGWMTNIASANKFARFARVTSRSNIDNMMGASAGLSCPVNPTISLMDCGSNITCLPLSSVVTLASVVVTTTGSAVQGTIINPTVTAGDFVAWIVGGSCTNSELNATVEIRAD